jgi:hypothetical protein
MMLIGMLMLLAPTVVFVVTLPFSGRLKPGLCKIYRILGGIIVIVGSGVSLYLAAYTGDQGGIGAFFFQLAVILLYLTLSMLLIIANWLLYKRE